MATKLITTIYFRRLKNDRCAYQIPFGLYGIDDKTVIDRWSKLDHYQVKEVHKPFWFEN